MKIPIGKTVFTDSNIKVCRDPLRKGWVSQGSYVEQFENLFSKFSKAPHSVAVSSGTAALHMALAALGISKGDEVIVPAFTWIATANAVEYVGAKPIFCDIDLTFYNIAIDQIESKISDKTKAIIAVHLFGLPVDMDSVMKIAKKYNLFVIEDAACAFGALYKDRHVGCFGDIGCFSFHPRKAITTGEGGMLTTRNAKLAEQFKSLRNHGAGTTDLQPPFLLPDFPLLGFNYRMTDLQAALGVSQLEKGSLLLKKRFKIAKRYDENLKDCEWLQLPSSYDRARHAYQAYVVLFRPEVPTLKKIKKLSKMRNKVMQFLQKKGIATRQGTHAVVLQSYYRKKYKLNLKHYPNAVMADRLSIALPLYPTLSQKEQNCVAKALKKSFRRVRYD